MVGRRRQAHRPPRARPVGRLRHALRARRRRRGRPGNRLRAPRRALGRRRARPAVRRLRRAGRGLAATARSSASSSFVPRRPTAPRRSPRARSTFEPHRRADPRRPARRSTAPSTPSVSRARATSPFSTHCTTRRSGSSRAGTRPRGQHGRGARQADGRARGLPGHARPGGDARVDRRPHRLPGLDAADPPDRTGGTRHARAGGVPGDRLPAHVQPDGEVGRADRPCRPDSGAGRARVLGRDRRTPRAGGARAARGHARRGGRRRRRGALPTRPDQSRGG